MPFTKKDTNPIILDDLKFNSLNVNNDLIIGISLLSNNRLYNRKKRKTILHYIEGVNKGVNKDVNKDIHISDDV